MTKLFVFVFLCMFTYGAFTFMWGPALIALFCACFMLWAGRSIDRQNQEWYEDIENAQEMLYSKDMLQVKECECSACTSCGNTDQYTLPKGELVSPVQNSEPDSKL